MFFDYENSGNRGKYDSFDIKGDILCQEIVLDVVEKF